MYRVYCAVYTVTVDPSCAAPSIYLFLSASSHCTPLYPPRSFSPLPASQVVTRTAKIRAVCVLVAMNVFFVYYSMLKGAAKGQTWQWLFLGGAVVQIMCEIFLFETMVRIEPRTLCKP